MIGKENRRDSTEGASDSTYDRKDYLFGHNAPPVTMTSKNAPNQRIPNRSCKTRFASGGTLGALLTGIFATSAVNPILHDAEGHVLPSGLLEGNAHQLVNQLVGVGIAWSIAIVGSIVLLKLTDLLVGLRVSEDDEVQGLDLSQHGEIGYDF
jgi:hypothetical protein